MPSTNAAHRLNFNLQIHRLTVCAVANAGWLALCSRTHRLARSQALRFMLGVRKSWAPQGQQYGRTLPNRFIDSRGAMTEHFDWLKLTASSAS